MPDAPAPIIILGTGRSFTSVTSCMIGQHPDMIGLPETNIFRNPTLGELFSQNGKLMARRGTKVLRSGLLRTLAHFHDGEQTDEAIDAAERFVFAHENWTSRELAAYIAKLAAPRGIVEKSISTCRDRSTVARVLEAWPNALFLHITRQPESIISSMRSRIESAKESHRRRLERNQQIHSLDEYFTHLTTTILEFMATLPPGRGMNLHGEHFLTDARLYARQICEWAGLDASDAAIESMMHPENNPFAFVGPEKAPWGLSNTFLEDPHFSGKPVAVKPLTIQAGDPALDTERRVLVLLGNRLGYA